MDSARRLRDAFRDELFEHFADRVVLDGHPEHRRPDTLDVSFIGVVGSELLGRLEGVAASTGSACHAGAIEISSALKAMDVPPEVAIAAIRFSLGRQTTAAEIDAVVERLGQEQRPALPIRTDVTPTARPGSGIRARRRRRTAPPYPSTPAPCA